MKQVAVGLLSRAREDGRPEYLLVRSKKDFGEFTGAWYPPGGHIEDGEDEKVALTREIKEELSIDVVPVEKIAESPGDVPNQITHWWRCRLLAGDLAVDRSEIDEARWFTKEEMKEAKLWPATEAFFESHIFQTSSEMRKRLK